MYGDEITQLHAAPQAYQSEVDICQLLQAMSLTKGKFKVGRFYFISEAVIDDRWKKGSRDRPCPRCIAKCTRARCKHRGPGIPCKSFPPQPFLSLNPNTPSSPTRRSHQDQASAAPPNPTPTPRPPRPPSSTTLLNFPHATSSNPSSLHSSPSPPSSLRLRTLTPLQAHFRRRTAFIWTPYSFIAVFSLRSLQHTEGAQRRCTRSPGRSRCGHGRLIGTRMRRRSLR